MSRSIPRRNIVIFCILGLDLHDTVGSVLWGWTASFHSPFSSNGLQHTFLLGWEFCVAWEKNAFLLFVQYSVEIERYYMKHLYMQALNLENYIVFTCFIFAPKPACKETKVFSSQTGTAWHGATRSVSVLPPPAPLHTLLAPNDALTPPISPSCRQWHRLLHHKGRNTQLSPFYLSSSP